MTSIGHVVTEKDQSRVHCSTDGCNKPAKVCLYNTWTVQSQSGISFWYHCVEHANRILGVAR
jgi:hypothetical protein